MAIEAPHSHAIAGHRWLLAGCLLLLASLFAMLAASTQLRPGEQRAVEVLLEPASADGPRTMRLRFDLPPTVAAQPRWALWFPREPVAGLQLSRADDWHSEVRNAPLEVTSSSTGPSQSAGSTKP